MSKRKKQCEHPVDMYEFRDGEPVSRYCPVTFGCGALLPLGPANDLDLHVQHEIAAAEIVARMQTGGPNMTNAELDGYNGDDSSPFYDLAGWHIGWLAAEATHDHSDGWAWDVSRPIADQLAETALVDAEADGLAREVGLMPFEAFDAGCKRVEVALGGVVEALTEAIADVPDCRGAAAARLRDDIAATAAGEDPVADQLADELCKDADGECDHRGTWSPDASVSECPKCLKTWRTEDRNGDDILPDEVAS